jgi:hypothetical protein
MADQPTPSRSSSPGPGTNDTSEYAPSKAPDTQQYAEERDPDGRDSRLLPGGAHGSPRAVGMDAMDRDTVPNHAERPGLTDYGQIDD